MRSALPNASDEDMELWMFSGWENSDAIGFFVFNTNLTFLYKIDIEGFKK